MLVEIKEPLEEPILGDRIEGDSTIKAIFTLKEHYKDETHKIMCLSGRVSKVLQEKGETVTRRTRVVVDVVVANDTPLKFDDLIHDMKLAATKKVYWYLNYGPPKKRNDFDRDMLGHILFQYNKPNGQVPEFVQDLVYVTAAAFHNQPRLTHYELEVTTDG